jgi:hypothetical protein
MTRNEKLIISAVLIVLGVACRLLPHFWNFAPITAVALFSGVYLGKRYAFFVPLAAMLIGDIFLGFYSLPLFIAVYGCFAVIGLIGLAVSRRKSLETVFAASVASSFLFFVVTNWVVWQFSPWYEKSLSGLIQCYALALPFFRGTIVGDLFYAAVLFGAYESVRYLASQKRLALAVK